MSTENWIAAITLFLTTSTGGLILFFKIGRIVETIEGMRETLRDVPKMKYSIDTMNETIASMKETLGEIPKIKFTLDAMKETLKDVPKLKYSFAQLSVKVDDLWKERGTASNSPRVLNDFGKKVLEVSGIIQLTDKYYTEILEEVKEHAPQNAFQAQEAVIASLLILKTKGDCREALENGAFNSGTDIDMILFVAAINLRDKIISELGLNSKR